MSRSSREVAEQQTSKAMTEKEEKKSYYKATIKEEEISDDKKKVIITNTYDGPIISGEKQVTTERKMSYVIEGEEIEYAIIARNDGGIAKDVIIKDQLPEGLEFVLASIKVDGQNIDSSYNNIEALETGITVNVNAHSETKLTFKAKVKVLEGEDLTKLEKTIKNIATVDGQETEVTIEVKKGKIISEKVAEIVKKTEDKLGIAEGKVTTGDEIVYKIKVSNIGKDVVNDIEVKDAVPNGTSLKERSISDGGVIAKNSNSADKNVTGNNNNTIASEITWTIPALEIGETKELSFTVIVGQNENGSIIRNTAYVSEMPTNETTTEYEKGKTRVIIHHYEEGTTNKLSENVEIDGRIGDEYNTVPATDIPSKYELVEMPKNATGIMTEDEIEVIYYYKVKDTSLIIKYLEKDTNKELAKQELQIGKVEEDYITEAKVIEGYTLVGDSGNTIGKLTIEPTTVIFYYLQNTKVTVNHIDKNTGEVLAKVEERGLVGDEYTSTSKNFDGYILVERPEKETVTMTKDEIVLNYYYVQISAGVIEKHIDIITGDILDNDAHEGNVGDPYDILAKEFEGYDLVEEKLPQNAKGIMAVNETEVIYYYIHKSSVTAEYIDKVTENKLLPDEKQDGHEGDDYTTERKQIDDYVLIEVPENADGTMKKEPTTVKYYYVHTTGGVIERHIDIITGKQLVTEEKFEGYEGDDYKTEPENIPYYDLVKERYPENAEGKTTIEQIIVNYYYIGQAKVVVNHIDIDTNGKLSDEEVIEGHEGDKYNTEPKDMKYYKLVEEKLPENVTGTMSMETTIDENGNRIVNNTTYVNYYYRKLNFNLSIDKKVNSIIVNGRAVSVNGKLGKVEIAKNDISSSKIEIIYMIRVTNKGELAGKAKLLENIPSGTVMNTAKNPMWEVGGETATLVTEEISPEETKEYEVILEWTDNGNNVGSKVNEVEILSGENEPRFEDSNKDDDKDTAEVIISISTGGTTYIAIAGVVLAILAGVGVILIKKKEE